MTFLTKLQSICLQKKGSDASDIREIKELLQDSMRETKRFMSSIEEKIYSNVDKMLEEKFGNYIKNQE